MQYIVKKIINKIPFLKSILYKIFDSSKKEKHNDELPYVLLKMNDLLFNLHRGSFISDRLKNSGSYEPYITQLIEAFVRKGDTVFDVGANIGIHTLTLSKAVGDDGSVIAFEPVKYLFEELNLNLHLNSTSNVKIVNVACGENDKISEMNVFKKGDFDSGNNSLVENEHIISVSPKRINKVNVKVINLDNFVQRHALSIDFIKMDIEGYEYYALRGMQKLIKQQTPAMIIEYNLDRIHHLGLSNKDFKNILDSQYDCYEIDRNNEDKGIYGLIPFKFDRFESSAIPGYTYVRTDLVCVPKTRYVLK
jgi:FkbM family methyltransferase